MGSIEEPPATISSTIPIVDFSKWIHGKNQADRLVVARQITDACRSVGFVYLTNHGLSQDRVDETFTISKQMFALPLEDKMKAPHPPGSAHHRGYSAPGSEQVSKSNADDASRPAGTPPAAAVKECKESYEIGSEEDAEQPNIWLPEDTLPGFRQTTIAFYWACHELATAVLHALSLGIGLQEEALLTQYHTGHHNQLRLLHYPPVPAAEVESGSAARMPPHADFGSITLLFQDDCGGLQIEDPRVPNKFLPATPVPGACVVNVGDLLMRWSNDYLKSTRHRVTLPPLADRFQGEERITRDRYSLVYFVGPLLDTVIECLPACADAAHPAKYEPVTRREFSKMKFAAAYGDGK
ncbi:thymine dioxygenase [Neohortaea acidophila]|uniref:Thymine dioxygenase n=1 Tax=Neohortaea acidophila TaxID=245834 RepID=A0A6A6PTN5_9PEZI|nr:thymine dioxygenase [Neohortaea acidophila]KAF2483460.1 thymine dioxygenase [Neohortaea acidophila]